MYKIAFFVPSDYAETVKQAVFKEGAGRLGNYIECSWEILGTGQFKPMEGSEPFLGALNKLEQVEELKIEMICDDNIIRNVVAALKQSHPYEEPAYEVIKLEAF